MGRTRKLPMMKRETPEQRSVSFTKRRQGLFSKAAELCRICNVQVAILVSSLTSKEKFYSFGHSSVDALLDAFLDNSSPLKATNNVATMNAASFLCEETKKLESELHTLERNKKRRQSLSTENQFSWDFEEFESIEELQAFVDSLESLMNKARSKLNNSTPPNNLGSSSNAAIISHDRSPSDGTLDNDHNNRSKSDDVLDFGGSPSGLCLVPAGHADDILTASDIELQSGFAYNGNNGFETSNIDCNIFSTFSTVPEPESVFNYRSDDDFDFDAHHLWSDIVQSPDDFGYNFIDSTDNTDGNNTPWTLLESGASGSGNNVYQRLLQEYEQALFGSDDLSSYPALPVCPPALVPSLSYGFQKVKHPVSVPDFNGVGAASIFACPPDVPSQEF